MKKTFTILSLTILCMITTIAVKGQCSNYYSHTYNNYIVYPYAFNADITGNGGATNLRIRTFQNGTGNKVLLDNPNTSSTIKYSGWNDEIYTTTNCGSTIGSNTDWTNVGLLADSSVLHVNSGTSYIKIRMSSNGVFVYGWLKIGITQTADTVFVYSLTIDPTATSPTFKVGQCDVTWPTVCFTDVIETTYDENPIYVYPNPAINELFIETGYEVVREVNIYNATGSLVSQTKQLQKSIDISQLNNGIYIAEIVTREGTQRVKWCKSN